MKSQQVAFDNFGTLDGVLRGEPIKIMPLGTFYRGQRKIEITSADLQQIATNVKTGLPRFRIPINENHAGDRGKIGTVFEAEFNPAGSDGPGLYATKYELTDVGKRLVAEKRFDAVSPEMVWSKNGAKYQDPQTGVEHDNVLVGLALTERPFFGHDNVAMFSEKPEAQMDKKNRWQRFKDAMAQAMKMMDETDDDEGDKTATLTTCEINAAELSAMDGFKDYTAEQRQEMAKNGHALPDGSYPIADGGDLANAIQAIGRASNPGSAKAHIIKRAKALGLADKLPPEWAGSTKEDAHEPQTQEADAMSEMKNAPETFMVTADEFKALKTKADLVDGLQTQADQFKAQLEQTATALKATQRERDLDRMVQHAENFTAIPGAASEIGEKLLQLKEKDPELFKWFDGLLVTLDKQLTQSELFTQKVSGRAAEGADTLEAFAEQLLAEKFGGDRSKQFEALKLAETQRPDLAKKYYQGV